MRVKVVKNKLAPPFRMAEFDIIYGQGISKEGSLIDVGVALEIIKKSGAWFTYEGEQLGQGKENARAFLKEHADVAAEIDRKIREAVGLVGFQDDDGTADKPVEIPDIGAPDGDEPDVTAASSRSTKQPAGAPAS